MLHYLTIGFLNPDAVRHRRIDVEAPLDPEILGRLLRKYSNSHDQNTPTFEGARVEVQGGYVRCPWWVPWEIKSSATFALELQALTGCVIADVEHGRVLSGADLVEGEEEDDDDDE